MSRRRHHYVPRFLLARFASRRTADKSWVWQFDREKAVEVSTKDAAVSRDFYGEPGTPIEDTFAQHEGTWARALITIDASADPSPHAETLREFVWALAMRGRSLRNQFSEFAARMLRAAAEPKHAALVRDVLHRRVLEELPTIFERLLGHLPAQVRDSQAESTAVQQVLLQRMLDLVNSMQVSAELTRFAESEQVEHGVVEAARAGQLRGLESVVDTERVAVPDQFRPDEWRLQRSEEFELVLGDSCVVCMSPDGETGTILRKSATWTQILLPVSRTSVLVGCRSGDRRELTADEINRASSETSTHYVYAGTRDERTLALRSAIGRCASPMTESELDELVATGWKNLGRRN